MLVIGILPSRVHPNVPRAATLWFLAECDFPVTTYKVNARRAFEEESGHAGQRAEKYQIAAAILEPICQEVVLCNV